MANSDENNKPRRARSRGANSELDPRGGADGDTSLSITVSPISVQVLSKGIDSIYASQRGLLDDFEIDHLKTLKQYAQSEDLNIRNQAQITCNDALFDVLKRGTKYFPYIIKDKRFNIQLSSGRNQIPLSYTQISAQYLAYVGPEAAIKELETVVGQLGTVSYTSISRGDLYIDVVTNFKLDDLGPIDFVGRPIQCVRYYSRGFEGLKFITDDLILRIYDKTKEIKVSKKEYMKENWLAAGWDGISPVYRIEFQLNSKALRELGVQFPEQLLQKQGSLWGYCTRKWIRIVAPGRHSSRDRWPTHEFWEHVQNGYGFTPAATRLKHYSRTSPPSDRYIFGYALSPLLAYMAKHQIFDIEKVGEGYFRDLISFHIQKYNGFENFKKVIIEKIDERLKSYGMSLSPKSDEDIPL